MKFIRLTLAATALGAFAAPAFAQEQAAPQQPPAAETTTTTTTTQDSSAAAAATPVPATAADLQIGATVNSRDGQSVGTIETVDAGGATVTTGTARARLALNAFTKNESGLIIGYTRADVNRLGAPVTAPAAPATGTSPAAGAPPASAAPTTTPAQPQARTQPQPRTNPAPAAAEPQN